MRVDWEDLRTFNVVADTGSFQKAATRMGVNQATVSRRIARLEKALALNLFDRLGTTTALTKEAAVLLEISSSMDRQFARFSEVVEQIKGEKDQVVRLKTTEGTANYLIIPVLSAYDGRLASAMRRELPTDFDWSSVKIATGPDVGEYDISISWTAKGSIPNASPSDRIVRLADVSFYPFYHPNYCFADRSSIEDFSDLADHNLVGLSLYEVFPTLGEWNQLFTGGRGSRFSVAWTTSIINHMQQGKAIGLLPGYTPAVVDTFRRVEVDVPDFDLQIWIHAPVDRLKDQAVRLSFDAIIACFSVLRNG